MPPIVSIKLCESRSKFFVFADDWNQHFQIKNKVVSKYI